MARERILLVDDSAQIREFLGHSVLASQGYDVLIAANGREGLTLAQDLHPDLIIADYQMPHMTGLEMYENLKAAGEDIPMILITDERSESLAVRALRLGIRDYLAKPLDEPVLLTSVRNVLNEYLTHQIRERLPAHLLEANRRLEKRIRQLGTLVNIGKSVTAMLDIQQVLNHVVDAAVQVTGAEEGSLLLVDQPTGELYMRAARNFDQKTVHTLRLPTQDSLAGQVIHNGQPIVLNGEDMIKIKTSYLVKGLIYVPIRIKQQVIGVLSVDNRTTVRLFDIHDVQILSILADFAAVAIENARLFAESVQERDTLDAILRDTEDHVIVVDSQSRILFCNPAACRSFKVTMTDFIGKPLRDAIQHPEVHALFEKGPTNGRGYRCEIALDEGERVLNAQLTVIKGVGCSAVMQDITYLKQLDRAKSEFVTTVSHDLRSPLTTILAYIELIQRTGPLNAQQEKFAEQITSSVHSIRIMIDELLELGRIEAGFDTTFEPVALVQIAQEVVASLEHDVAVKGHILVTHIAPDVPRIVGNSLRLRQVLANLLGNAIKYTPANGQIGLNIKTDSSMVVIQISDTGIGIPLEDQPYVFDKFFRTERAISEFEGTGLGLSIVKSIVEQHNGRIWLSSKEGEGTTFTVVLPFDVSKRVESAAPLVEAEIPAV